MKECRSRIKQDPKKLQEQGEKAKVRKKKYRDKKKEEGIESRTKSTEVQPMMMVRGQTMMLVRGQPMMLVRWQPMMLVRCRAVAVNRKVG